MNIIKLLKELEINEKLYIIDYHEFAHSSFIFNTLFLDISLEIVLEQRDYNLSSDNKNINFIEFIESDQESDDNFLVINQTINNSKHMTPDDRILWAHRYAMRTGGKSYYNLYSEVQKFFDMLMASKTDLKDVITFNNTTISDINDEANLIDVLTTTAISGLDTKTFSEAFPNSIEIIRNDNEANINEKIIASKTINDNVLGDDKITNDNNVLGDDKTINDNVLGDDKTINDNVLGDDKITNDNVLGDDKITNDNVLGDDKITNDSVVGDETVNMKIVDNNVTNDKTINDTEINDNNIVNNTTNSKPIVKNTGNILDIDNFNNHEIVYNKDVFDIEKEIFRFYGITAQDVDNLEKILEEFADLDLDEDSVESFDFETMLKSQKKYSTLFFKLFMLKFIDVPEDLVIFYISRFLRRIEDFKISYDSVILSDENLPLGYPRLLSVDQVLILPAYTPVRLLITSNDVIHS